MWDGYSHGTQHPHCTSTTSRSVSPKLRCYLALKYARVAQPLEMDVYEPLAIITMHLVLPFQCLLKYDERHSKWYHYVQPKFSKEVKPPDQKCLGFLNNIRQKQNLPTALSSNSRMQHRRKSCPIQTFTRHCTTHKSIPIILNNRITPGTNHLTLYMTWS